MVTIQECEKLYNNGDKWRVSVLSGLVFLIVASPYLSEIIAKVGQQLGIQMPQNGLANLFVAAVIFTLIVRAMMK